MGIINVLQMICGRISQKQDVAPKWLSAKNISKIVKAKQNERNSTTLYIFLWLNHPTNSFFSP
jgi:hypothetical protein